MDYYTFTNLWRDGRLSCPSRHWATSPTNLLKAQDEIGHSRTCVGRCWRRTGRQHERLFRQVGGDQANIVDGRNPAEETVLRVRQLESNLFRKLRQPVEKKSWRKLVKRGLFLRKQVLRKMCSFKCISAVVRRTLCSWNKTITTKLEFYD